LCICVCYTAFKESSSDLHVVVARGYANTGDKKFNIKAGHKKIVAPEIGSTQNATWLLVSCQEGLKGSRMRKFLKDVQIIDEEDPSQICKNNRELVAIGMNDDKLVYQPFKIVVTDDDTFCVSRESFKTLKPSGPVLDKEKIHVLGHYWSRENKMVISWLARGQVVIDIADEIVYIDAAGDKNGGNVGVRYQPSMLQVMAVHKPKVSMYEIELNIYRKGKQDEEHPEVMMQMSSDDPLEKLWEKDSEFRNQICSSLDRVYKIKSTVKYWPNLADDLKVPRKDHENFSKGETLSPSERMFRYIEAAKPRLTIEQLLVALKKCQLDDLHCVFEDYIDAGYMKKVKFVSEMGSFTPNILGQVMVKMDRNKYWKELSTQLEIPKRVFDQFDEELVNNPTRQLLHLAHTRNTKITVEDLKSKLETLDRDDVLKDFKEVPDKIGIDALLNHFDVTEHIEAKLNREDSFLQNWRHLAELYKADGLISDEDIKSLEPEKDARSPTAGLLLYVLQRDSSSVKIEDLVVHCAKLRRTDCLNVIATYFKGTYFNS
ncbi:hypothetical protein QZH41_020142, partial [Actinostola sp. cb2023]